MKTFTVEGQNYLEKTVSKQSNTTGKIYLPGAWIGRRVAVILLDRPDELLNDLLQEVTAIENGSIAPVNYSP